MSADAMPAVMLAGRHLLERSNTDLIAWSRCQWDGWLHRQRNPGSDPAGQTLTVVATLSSIADLDLHVGIMQLLRICWLRCTLILSLATGELARVIRSQARREGWEALVHFIVESECNDVLGRLAADEILAVFAVPTVLEHDELDYVVASTISRESSEHKILRSRAGFLGRIGSYVAGPPSMIGFEPPFAAVLPRLLSLSVDELEAMPDPPFSSPSPADEEGLWRGILTDDGRVEVAGGSLLREIAVTANPNSAGAVVVARQRGDLFSDGMPVRIRVPAALLTTEPHRIRIEVFNSTDRSTSPEFLFHVPPSQLKPWMLSAFLNRGGAGNPVVRAFAEGVGCRIAYAEDEPDILRDIPVVWGVLRDSDRILAQAKAQGLYFFYIDHAYFDRGHSHSYRVTRNAYEAGPIRLCPDDRITDLAVEIAPWRMAGREIIVCPPTEFFMRAHGCEDWLERTLEKLEEVTDRPLIVRQKPKAGEQATPLPKALQTAYALVTHSSNVAIEAVCLGTPVFVAPTSAAAPVGRTNLEDIETPVYPDREPWLAHLAYNQFTLEEFADGTAWRMLLELEERDLA